MNCQLCTPYIDGEPVESVCQAALEGHTEKQAVCLSCFESLSLGADLLTCTVWTPDGYRFSNVAEGWTDGDITMTHAELIDFLGGE